MEGGLPHTSVLGFRRGLNSAYYYTMSLHIHVRRSLLPSGLVKNVQSGNCLDANQGLAGRVADAVRGTPTPSRLGIALLIAGIRVIEDFELLRSNCLNCETWVCDVSRRFRS